MKYPNFFGFRPFMAIGLFVQNKVLLFKFLPQWSKHITDVLWGRKNSRKFSAYTKFQMSYCLRNFREICKEINFWNINHFLLFPVSYFGWSLIMLRLWCSKHTSIDFSNILCYYTTCWWGHTKGHKAIKVANSHWFFALYGPALSSQETLGIFSNQETTSRMFS